MFRKAILILAVAAMAFSTSTAQAGGRYYGGGFNRGFGGSSYYRGNSFNRGFNSFNRGGFNSYYRGNSFNRGFNSFNRGGFNSFNRGGFNRGFISIGF